MAPMAEPDDGLFEVIVVGDVGRFFSVTRLNAIRSGTHLDQGDPRLKVLRGRNIQVQSEGTVRVDLDGEDPGVLPASFEMMPSSIDLLVP